MGEEAEHPRFAAPVLMVVDVADLVAAGVDMGLLGLWTRPDASHPWTLVHNAKYDAERQVWFAYLRHFSDFATGIQPSASNERLPSVDGFSSDRHTGAVTINYPIVTPAGLGGLSPNLSLNYSTMAVDDIFAELGHDDGSKRIQANMAGYGWNLGGVNYITKNRDNDDNVYYTLILNGASYDIYENPYQPGTYDTNPMSFAAITNTFTISTSVWKIKTTDGMYYEFGGDLPDLNWTSGITRSLYVEMRTSKVDEVNELEVVSWYLRHVEDTAGNTMDYHYEVERANILTSDTGGGGCLPHKYAGEDIGDSDYAGNWYNPVTRLTSVTWSSNVGKYGTAQDARLRVRFEYLGDRTDFDHTNNSGAEDDFTIFDGCQPRKTQQRLEEIEVQAREYDSADWHLLRRYNLDSSYAQPGTNDDLGTDELLRHLLLSKIHEYGAEGALFNTHTFSYTKHLDDEGDTENSIWLKRADNGVGGTTFFYYEIKKVDCVIDHGVECDDVGDLTRHLLDWQRVEDGQTPETYYMTGYEYGGLPLLLLYKGRFRNLGFNHSTTTIYTPTTDINLTVNYTTTLNQARFEDYEFYQLVSGGGIKPDPKHGRLKQVKVYDNNNLNRLYAHTTYQWSSHSRDSASSFAASNVFSDTIHWIRLDQQNEWVDGAGMQKTYEYSTAAQDGTQYGNVTAVEEWSNATPVLNDSQWLTASLELQRRTETVYYPNDGWPANPAAPYLVSLPARTLVEDGDELCQAETRTIYASDLDPDSGIQNRDGAFNNAPSTAFVIKSEQVIDNCPYAATGNREDGNLLVTTYARDEYGNEKIRTSHNGGSPNNISIFTEYDSFYHLFPIARWNDVDDTLKSRASYYGIDATALNVDPGFWGAMKESCEINDICTRFTYDEFGRTIRQWDRQPRGSSWPVDAAANVLWGYRKPGELDPSQTAYIVSEWHAPRCDGNFVRRHYDGLGQLVIEQKSYQDYDFEVDGCGVSDDATGREIVTFFQYDALGNQIVATVPELYVHPYAYYAPTSTADAQSETAYDPLSRPTTAFAPNGEQTEAIYSGRYTHVIGVGRNGAPNKTLRWQLADPLGYMRLLRTVFWNAMENEWDTEGEILLTHNVVGNLTQIQHHSNLGTSTYSYDQAGRMTGMDDVDLGNWSYLYNRHNQLTEQEDARNVTTCLSYDSFGRLIGKKYTATTCPSVPPFDVRFEYGDSGTEAGQLIFSNAHFVGGNEYFSKTVAYNALGQLITETVSYPEWGASSAGYAYDAYGRVAEIRYPDGEEVTYGYNGMGLQDSVASSSEGIIADAISYDLLGRMGAARYPAGTGDELFLTQSYYPWQDGTSNGANARLQAIRIGTEPNIGDELLLVYRYDSHGNILEMDERYAGVNQVTHTFDYDRYNRLAESFYTSPITVTQTYTFLPSSRPEIFVGKHYAYAAEPVYGPSEVTRFSDSAKLFLLYDANGNLQQRQYFDSTGVTQTQVLFWDIANQLVAVAYAGATSPTYSSYDSNGGRTIMQQGTEGNLIGNIYPFTFYEVEWVQAASTISPTRYYLLNGKPIALRIGNDSTTYLHRDQVSSVVMSTKDGAILDSRQYYAYGRKRGGDEFPFEQDFTGQRRDSTGLLYYNARYYDPELGMFISPDSMIPDPTDFFSYNRYLYGRGNPISNNDPTGHRPCRPGDCVPSGWDGQQMRAWWEPYKSDITWSDFVATRMQFETYVTSPELFEQDYMALMTSGDEAAKLRIAKATYWQANALSQAEVDLSSEAIWDAILLDLASPGTAEGLAGMGVILLRALTTETIIGAKTGTHYPVSYDHHGYPILAPYAIATVKINMRGNRTTDFTAANRAAGIRAEPKGYTWHHHEDGITMQLVPTELHGEIYHYGGVYTIKNGSPYIP